MRELPPNSQDGSRLSRPINVAEPIVNGNVIPRIDRRKICKGDTVCLVPARIKVMKDRIEIIATLKDGIISQRKAWHRDVLLNDATLDNGYYSPLRQRVRDSLLSDAALYSGQLLLVAFPTDAPTDRALLDVALSSGDHALTVGAVEEVEDRLTLDLALDSGYLTLVVVVTDAPEDRALLDIALSSGDHTLAVGGVLEPTDKLTLDAALYGGAYA